MGKMYEDWNKLFCDELCEEIKKFEHGTRNDEQLCRIEKLIKVKNGLAEMEMDGAIRQIAEDRYGYDSDTGRFHDTDQMYEFADIFNASRGGRRRRDSRGRYMAAVRPNVHYPYDPNMYPWDVPYGTMNDGRDYMRDGDDQMMNAGRGDGRRSGDRGGRRGTMNDGRSYPNGSTMDDDSMYMLRQQNGMPIMTPYNMGHDVPKKLTEEQCEEWMDKLVNSDGSTGPKWSKAQVEAEAKRAGIDISKYGSCLMTTLTNAMYADYSDVGKAYNCDKPSFYIRLAESFLDDSDFEGSPMEKASIYFHKIVEHE